MTGPALDGHGQAVPQRGQQSKLGTQWQSHLRGDPAPADWQRAQQDLVGDGAGGDRAGLTVNSSWQQLEVVGRAHGMAGGTVQS